MIEEKRWPLAVDREMHVEPDQVVRTAWIHIDDVVLGSRHRRAIGDVERKYQKLLQMGDSAPFPPPFGHWGQRESGSGRDRRFVILDGGHEYLARLMLGHERIFVAWLDRPSPPGVDT